MYKFYTLELTLPKKNTYYKLSNFVFWISFCTASFITSFELVQGSTTCSSLTPVKWLSGFDKTLYLNLHLIIIRIELITF